MLGSCPQCKKPTAARGLTCDSCLGEAHRPKSRRRKRDDEKAERAAEIESKRGSIIVEVDGVPTEVNCEDTRAVANYAAAVGRDASGANANGGLKFSIGKPRPSLFPAIVFWHIVLVLTFGAAKYTKDGVPGDNNWQKNCATDYVDALERHLLEWKMGRTVDPESGYHPLAHAAVSLIFVLWFELTGKGRK